VDRQQAKRGAEARLFGERASTMDVSRVPGTHEIRVPYDNEIVLRVPAGEAVSEPLLSVVIPAMDEEAVVGEFLDWCRVGIENARIAAEIIIVDSSSDRTGEIALASGARVLRTPRRGLGRAYIDAIPFVRGRYVLMGDADCTYDFRELSGFVEKFEQGCEFIHAEPRAVGRSRPRHASAASP
jgi:hypothetical protein